MARVIHPYSVSDRNRWSALMLTEIVAAMALFVAVVAAVGFILGTLG